MGCGCGKGSSTGDKREPKQGGQQQQQFVLTVPSGETMVFGSRLEAEAMRVRMGRKGSIARR